jgi:nicotinamidase-related amidase
MPHVAVKSTSEDLVFSAIQSALGLCDNEGIRSVALTYFATGYGGWSPARSSDIMLKSTINYVTMGTKIKEIRFVAYEKVFGVFQKSLLEAFFGNIQCKISPAILVVDMIKDFFGPDKIIHEQETKNLCNNINGLLSIARSYKVPIIFLNDSHENEKDWEFTRTPVHALKGSEGSYIIDGIDYQGEKIVEKSRYDGFHHTELEDMLRKLGANIVILCGVQTHVCVLLTALSAFYRGLRPIIVRDCTSSSTKDKHDFGLWYLETYGGDTGDARDVEGLIQIWKREESR